MKRYNFLSTLIMLLTLFLLTSLQAQVSKSVNAQNDVITYSGSNLDSATTHTPVDGFSLGNYYNYTSYPVEYVIKFDTTAGNGTAEQLPKVSIYWDCSYDNENWLLKVDTVKTSDSVIARHRGTTNFNGINAPYWRPVFASGAGRDSISINYKVYFKKE